MSAVSARTLLVVGAGSGLTTALVNTGASAVLASAVASEFGGGEFRLLLLGLFIGTVRTHYCTLAGPTHLHWPLF
jgi:di/tricarboxylate transporter